VKPFRAESRKKCVSGVRPWGEIHAENGPGEGDKSQNRGLFEGMAWGGRQSEIGQKGRDRLRLFPVIISQDPRSKGEWGDGGTRGESRVELKRKKIRRIRVINGKTCVLDTKGRQS